MQGTCDSSGDVTAGRSGLDISRIEPLLACTQCAGSLKPAADHLACQSCATRYEVREGIPILGRVSTAATPKEGAPGQDSRNYQTNYVAMKGAESYRSRYEQEFFKRLSTRREIRRIRELLRRGGHSRVILDIPCGNGRVSAPLAESCELLIEADIGFGQVLLGRDTADAGDRRVWMTASAFAIPFKDNSVDGIVCNRLLHHLYAAEREQVFAEMLRVAARFVILNFYDGHSLKSFSRRLRGTSGPGRPEKTMTAGEVAAIAEKHGARLEKSVPLWFAGSRFRYARLVKP